MSLSLHHVCFLLSTATPMAARRLSTASCVRAASAPSSVSAPSRALRAAANMAAPPQGLPTKGAPPELPRRVRGTLPTPRRIAGVAHTVAVASAKGGVGKSTVAGVPPPPAAAASFV